MSRIWNFHGGIHPQENKQQSLTIPLRQMPLPKRLTLPLQQHIGTPAIPTVKVGDKVLKGQRIAEPSGFVSIYMHAPTSGTIVEIGDYPVPHVSGMSAQCIILEPDGNETWIEHQGVEDFRTLEKAELAEIIRCAGISGMGGAGFPTNIKLHLSDDHIVNTLIINGVECEPYITADDMLMRERAAEIIGGIEIAAYLIKPTHILIGIEDNKPEAAVAMTEAARTSKLNIEVVVLPTKYPSGGERQLIKLVTGVEVPHGQLPADIGIVVQNVGTMSAVYQAVHDGKPLISRITTLTGKALSSPGNLEVLLGTPIADLLDFCGVDSSKQSRLVMGGPMMGYTLNTAQIPVIKTSNCVIAGTLEEFPPAPPAQSCIRCGNCEQVCPAELLPQQLHWFAKGKEFDKALNHNLMDCIECGACSFVCPSNIPLVQYYRYAKSEIRNEQQEQRKAEQARIRFEARQARLEAAQQEKEERRKARAEAASKAQAAKRKAPVTTTTDSAIDPEAELKQLKTQAAVARTKLKKAEKALQEAEQNGADNIDQLKQDIESAKQKSELAQKAFSDAENKAPAPAAPSLKDLKVAAALARTKVSKTEKVLADAEAKGAPSVDQLKNSLQKLKEKAEQAQKAYNDAEASETAGNVSNASSSQGTQSTAASTSAAQPIDPPQNDVKALKSALAIARTKLKKAEKALAKAEEEGIEELEDLKQAVAEQQAKTDSAAAAFAKAEADCQTAKEATNQGPDIKALKTAAAAARTKLKKTEKALADAQAQGSASAEPLEKALSGLQAKVVQAEKALQEAQAQEATLA
ncbi:electron transport complex subunit RsxC [Motiliproteus sp. MSK22-1]|uniref:electron transport complex subunit RsxC n=1 Tax=Motiliproteus sp. MSK22-1 TaxID=1897630 RepID=UPI0009763606|nr:electron transport complex subunit RsxC [Motiliproteus sp. MSK22-1]OMH33771.1 electron transport complex subunit RsxC [Motiliproteus sp. MSK22-1]